MASPTVFRLMSPPGPTLALKSQRLVRLGSDTVDSLSHEWIFHDAFSQCMLHSSGCPLHSGIRASFLDLSITTRFVRGSWTFKFDIMSVLDFKQCGCRV